MTPRATLSLSSLLALSALSCGGPPPGPGGPTERPGPFLESTTQPARMVVFTAHRPPATLRETATCGATAYFFDPNGPNGRSRNQLAREGDCTLYPPPVDLQIPQQTWLCLGGLNVSVGPMPQSVSFCPAMSIGNVGANGIFLPFQGCEMLSAGTSVTASSASDLAGDELDDLDLTAALPAAVAITAPITTALGGWPATGDLDVRWQSAGSSSAVVTLEARDTSGAGGASAYIVCLPRNNGQLWIPSALIATSNLRTREARLTVAAYKDAIRPMSGAAREYRLSAGFSTSVVLQPGR